MTATVTKDTRKHFFVALLGFLAVFFLGMSHGLTHRPKTNLVPAIAEVLND